jgi:quercetin dioxygenase-like cupin family protein
MKLYLLIVTVILVGVDLSPVYAQEEEEVRRFDLIIPPRIVLTKAENTYKYELNENISVRDVVTQTGHVAQVQFEKGGQTLHHNHPEEETIVMISGKLKVVVAENEYTIVEGDVLNIEPYAPHHIEALEKTYAIEVFGPGRAMIR